MPGPTPHLPRAPVPFQSNPRLHMLIKLAHSPLLSSSSLRIPLVIFRRPAPTHGHLLHTQPSRPPTPHPPHVSVQARTSHLSSAHYTSPAPTPFPGTDFSLATPMFPQALVSCYAHRCPSHRLPTPPGPAGLEEAGVSSTSSLKLPPPNPLSYRDLRGPSQLFAGHPRISLPSWEIRPDSYRYNFLKAIFYTVLSKAQSYLLSLRRMPVNFLLSLYTATATAACSLQPAAPAPTLSQCYTRVCLSLRRR